MNRTRNAPHGQTDSRISVPLSYRTRQALDAFAQIEGTSLSAVLYSLLTDATPALEQMVSTVQAARAATDEGRAELVSRIEAALPVLEQAKADGLAAMRPPIPTSCSVPPRTVADRGDAAVSAWYAARKAD